MVDDATIRVGSDVMGAIAGILAVGTAMEALEGQVLAASTVIAGATAEIGVAFIGIGVAAATMATGGIAVAIDSFSEFEQAVVNATSVTGAFGEEYVKTKANVEALSRYLGENTVFSAQQAADAMYYLASAGYDVREMTIAQIKPMLDLAAATGNELVPTVRILVGTLAQYGLTLDDAGHVADVFVGAITSSQETLQKLGLSYRYVGNIAAMFGETVEDSAAAMALLSNTNLRGEQIGRSLRIAYQRLANPTADVLEVLQELGLTAEDVNQENMTLNDTMMLLAARGASVGQMMKFFGVESATAMGSLVANTPLLAQFEQQLGDVGGLAEQIADQQLNTLENQMTILKSKLNDVAIEIGTLFNPYARQVVQILQDIVTQVRDNINPLFQRLREYVADLQPTWDALYSSMQSIMGITQDLAGEDAIGWLITQVNRASVAVALILQLLDQHPIILQFAKLVMATAVAFVALSTAVEVAAIVYGVYQGILVAVAASTLIVNGLLTGTITLTEALAAVVGLLGGPVTILVALLAIFAGAWYTNFGGIREFTYGIVDDLKGIFWDLVDTIDGVMMSIVDGYNRLMMALGKDDKVIEVKGFRKGMEQALQNASDNIDYYIKDPLSEAFTLDAGGMTLFNQSALDTAAQTVESMSQDMAAVAESQVATTESAQEMYSAYAASAIAARSGRISMPSGYSSSDEADVREFGSYADVQAARASGSLKPGTVWQVTVNTGDVKTSSDSDGDSIGSVVNKAVSQAGGV